MSTIHITDAEQAEFNRQGDVANVQLDAILDNLCDGDEDAVGVLYALWVSVTHLLAHAGWTGEQLANDVHHHAALATSEGGVQ